MENKRKKFFIIPITVLLLISLFSAGIFENKNEKKPFIASAVTYVGKCGEDAIWSCDLKLGTLIISGIGETDNFDDVDKVPWNKYIAEITNISIDNGITSIGDNMFNGAKNLRNAEISKSVVRIGKKAFYGCLNLSTVEIKNNSRLEKIDDNAFSYCRNLRNISIPSRINEIGKEAFLYCYGIENLSLGYSVKSVGEGAFSCCPYLKTLRIVDSNCKIFDSPDTIYQNITVEGFNNSTAKEYSEKYLRAFSKIKDIISLSDMKIELEYDSKIYNGKKLTPKVKIPSLKKNKDYSVYYSDNLNPGIAGVTVSGLGDVLGDVTLNFKILPRPVKSLKVSNRKENLLTFTWDKITGADKYAVYQKTNNSWEKIKTTAKEKITVKDLKPATIYCFKISSVTETVEGDIESKMSDEFEISTKPETPSSVTATILRGGGGAILRWSRVSNISGYEVHIAAQKDGEYKLIADLDANERSHTVRNLKNNETYFFQIRAYKEVNGLKVYSVMSESVTVGIL